MSDALTEEDRMLKEGDYQGWYQVQVNRIEKLAKREDPAVRRTLQWSLPLLRKMANGSEPPVLPPPARPTARDLRMQNEEAAVHAEEAPSREVLKLGAGA